MKKFIKMFVFAMCTALITAMPGLAKELVLKGSTTVLPIAHKAAEAYMALHPDVKISLSGGGSGNGIKAIVDGTADIGNASRFIKEKEVKLCNSKGVYPVPHRIALDSIVPVVNAKNSVSDLSKAQLKDIFLGKIKNWKDVGGKDMKIIVISRDSSSGTFGVWKKLIMDKERVVPTALTVPSNGGLVQAVSTTPGALGYIALGYLTDTIKALSVNKITGNADTTRNGYYPLSRPLFMFTNSWPAGTTLDFLNFVLSPKGQQLVKEAGSIPVY
ncbi:MAG: PstS family phosphate ABC transporter substrate-binding protein [Thermodesulfobacteriota bacterium]|nr:PstS family phosphate ABC transporter substrate-binding protein [Thermodesulfobacteriota bacterium]